LLTTATPEQEMLERTNCEIWGYDFSVDNFGPQIQDDVRHRTHFTKAAIGSTTDVTKNPPSYTIQDLMAKNGHDYVDIMKVDIEYAEFNALSSLNAHTQQKQAQMPIGQVLIEIHLMVAQGITPNVFLDWWESLEYRGFRSAWTEPNLLVVTMGIENRMPAYSEVCHNPPESLSWPLANLILVYMG
jgi:hypothetical protein